MRRLLLFVSAVAIAAAARAAIARSRKPSGDLAPPPAAPAAAPAPPPAEPAPAPEPPVSVASPAAETVKAAGELSTEPAAKPDDSQLEREVEAQLAASPVAAEAEVTVEVRDRIASLEGTVPDPQTAMVIGDEAAHVEGVQGLDNRLRPEREEPAEREEAARDATGETRDAASEPRDS
jgi:hypothetical protein